MEKQEESFSVETTKAFYFLERQYGYQRLENDIHYPEYANLNGDTSLFPTVMEYYVARQKKLRPGIRFPGLKQEKPPSS